MIKQIKRFIVIFIALINTTVPVYASTTIGANAIDITTEVSDVVENKSVIEEQVQICYTLPIISENKVETNTQQEVYYSKGWISEKADIKQKPNEESETLTTFDINTEVEFTYINSEWYKIKYESTEAYVAKNYISFEKIEKKLNAYIGVFYGPSGKETYYNLSMKRVISYMKDLGYDYEYWVREDGVKMYGEYIMVAANTKIRSKGTILETSLGTGMVCDHCVASETTNQIDIAVTW